MFSLCHCNYLVLVGENTLICLNRQTVFFSANQLCVCVCVCGVMDGDCTASSYVPSAVAPLILWKLTLLS